MLQTNGPVRDYARYVTASTNKFLRPQAPSECTDAALLIYRQHFSRLLPLCFIPTLCISGFLIIFYQLIFPRLFETQFSEDTNLQVLEFCIFLFIGLTVGTTVANIGFAKLVTYADVIVRAVLNGEELNTSEIQRRSSLLFTKVFKTTFRASWYLGGILLLSFIPLVFGGFLISITTDTNWLPTAIAMISIITIPVGTILFFIRLGISMGILSVATAEDLGPKMSVIRAKYLLTKESRPTNSNPAVVGVITSFIIYLFLRLGYSLLETQLGFRETILNAISFPVVRVACDIFISILPEMLMILVSSPFVAIASSYYYYQRRIQVEGMDIEALYEKLPTSRR